MPKNTTNFNVLTVSGLFYNSRHVADIGKGNLHSPNSPPVIIRYQPLFLLKKYSKTTVSPFFNIETFLPSAASYQYHIETSLP